MKEIHSTRLKALRQRLKKKDLDAFIILDRENTFYYTGFRCTYSVLIVDHRSAFFFTDPRYGESATKELENLNVSIYKSGDLNRQYIAHFRKKQYKKVGFEGSISFNQYRQMNTWVGKAKLMEESALPGSQRISKDSSELRSIRKAIKIAEELMHHVADHLKPGVSEIEISRMIRTLAEELGGEGESFENIVASGPNSSRPHHHPGNRKIKERDPVTIDLGVVYNGYCSDITRTFVIGKPRKEFKEIYDVCLEANQEAIKAVKAGVSGAEVDQVARSIIAEAGYAQYFGHGLGHGIGLEIHEAPRLSQLAGDYHLEPGNVVTVEPGIYLPGTGGVRIEDDVLVTDKGQKTLTTFPKELISL